VISLQWLFQLNSDGTGYLAQRVMACADEREARVASVVFTFTQVVVRSLLWLIIGVALLALFPPAGDLTGEALVAEREMLFARGIDELLPPGLRGLMLTAMLAALASTLDTHLNWGAGYWANDLYKDWWLARVRKRAPGPRELVVVARLSNLLLIGVALAIMTHLESIQSAWHLSLLFGAGMGSVLVLRWLWERINLYCELLAILTSIVVAPLLLIFVDEEWLRLALMAATSTAAVVAAALLLPVTQPERLVAVYRQVRPPGWWGETAVRAGESPQVPRERLVRAAMAIAACAVSVYGTLVGCAQIALRTADFGTALLLLAALVAVPVWLRFVRSGSSPSADPSASGR
jgi:Na+/proline symporter